MFCSGYGITKVLEGLEPITEYSYRLCYITTDNKKSEFSQILSVKTTSKRSLADEFVMLTISLLFLIEEPITGEALHKAIILERTTDVEKILDSQDGKRVIEIPDKYGNFPLMVAVNRNNLE